MGIQEHNEIVNRSEGRKQGEISAATAAYKAKLSELDAARNAAREAYDAAVRAAEIAHFKTVLESGTANGAGVEHARDALRALGAD